MDSITTKDSTQIFGRIVGTSPALRRVLEQVEMVSRADSTVIRDGETGDRKSVV